MYQYYAVREHYQQDWSVCLWSLDIFHCGAVLLPYLPNKTSTDGNWWWEHGVPPTWEKDKAANTVVQLSETIKGCWLAGRGLCSSQWCLVNLDWSETFLNNLWLKVIVLIFFLFSLTHFLKSSRSVETHFTSIFVPTHPKVTVICCKRTLITAV